MKLLFTTSVIWLLSFKAMMSQINFAIQKVPDHYLELLNLMDQAIYNDEFKTIHSVLIVENGQLIFEKYYHNWPKDSVHQLQSGTKSIISALLGCALQQGCIKNVEEPISNYFPANYFSTQEHSKIKIKDLLTQRHGLLWKEDDWNNPDNSWRKILYTTGDWYRAILQLPMASIPGLHFNYSNAAPVLITGLIQNACCMSIDSFAEQFLWVPLNIQKVNYWQGNGGPQNNGMSMISLTSRDMAKIGQLYLQGGVWNGRVLIPETYINESWKAQVDSVSANGLYTGYDYGYLWWSNPRFRLNKSGKSPTVYLARGAGGQNIIVWPEKKRVIIITAWNMTQSNLAQAIFDKYLRYL